MTEVEALRAEIKAAQEAYYGMNPILSDTDYDAKLERLRSMDASAPELTSVGAAVPGTSVWEKVRHEIPMGSLNKANSWEEIQEWAKGITYNSFFITHKVDGSSMELVYVDGNLVRAVTRGDGVIGEDVIENVRQIPNVPSKLPVSHTVTVRGEVVMMKRIFEEKYSQDYANPRNTAAGKVREKKNGGRDCLNLHFLAYDADIRPGTMLELFEWLKEQGFETPHMCGGGPLENIKQLFEIEATERPHTHYEIDGMVVSANDIQVLEELGSHNMRPRGQIAWKFDALQVEAVVNDIVWQVGNTGRVTGVAKLEPVQLGGVTVTNVSLHNLKYFRQLGLWKGCKVRLTRANDVIPYITGLVDQ